ncbi:porin [Castellaniella sp.]|uniref:porin n=1 Tax=Castellaniella sp. TaxID=1955812 RepID=UPI00355D81D1
MPTPHLIVTGLLSGLCLAGPVQAASSITLYGIVDAGYGYTQYRYQQGDSAARATTSGVRSGYLKSSRFGLKGTEDLGDGSRALFLLEQEFNLGDGTAKANHAFSKKAYLGLSNERWGTLTLGRQKSISDQFISVNTTRSLGKATRAFGGAGVTRDNMFQYVSPAWSGLQFGVGYAADGAILRHSPDIDADADRTHFLSTGVRYRQGPLRLSATLDRERANDKNGHARSYAVTNWVLAGSYDFDVVRLTLAYGQDRNGKLKKPGDISSKTFGGHAPTGLGDYNNPGFRSHNYYLGLSAPLGGGRLGLTWSHTASNLDDVYADLHPGQTLATAKQNIYAAVFTYPLSRRTTAYSYASYGTGLAYLADLTGVEAGLAIQHRF